MKIIFNSIPFVSEYFTSTLTVFHSFYLNLHKFKPYITLQGRIVISKNVGSLFLWYAIKLIGVNPLQTVVVKLLS